MTDMGDAHKLAEKYGYRDYMVARYLKMLGYEQTREMLEWNDRPLIPVIRVNTLKIPVKQLQRRLEKKGFQLRPINIIPYGIKVLNEPHNLGSLHEFLQGYFYIQSAASMIPPIILDPKPKDLVIDTCAAPGSKATQLAQIMGNKGKLILIEKNSERLRALDSNLKRLGVQNVLTFHMDAMELDRLNIKADKILLDAPCTGEGLIRQDPSRKTSRTEEDIEKMANIQKKLLQTAIDELKEGGELVYSTCSIAPEENEFVINSILKKNRNIKVMKPGEGFGVPGFTKVFGKTLDNSLQYAQRIFPHIHDSIGFFFCLLKKD
ncbi:MAG: RsmB/NOP family class I SAM-dependent RNA methyltransferase [Promethearchaeia archaeon]